VENVQLRLLSIRHGQKLMPAGRQRPEGSDMKYCDLRPAIKAYAEGLNVTEVLRELLGEQVNTGQIIEIAYDLQAGSYIQDVHRSPERWRAYTSELSQILTDHVADGDRVLEVGTGEMTTLAGVANSLCDGVRAHYALDISWSRLRRGRDFVANSMCPEIAAKLNDFVADLFQMPLRDKSIDVIWTAHALEPNGGKEREALEELFRVARKRVVLFEPSYENNSADGRARMDSLGYIRGLPEAIQELGAQLEALRAIKTIANPLNPTYAYVLTPPGVAPAEPVDAVWACPATRLPMEGRGTCFWSEGSRLAYPIIDGIPVLRPDAAVLASAFG
jgi:ubiquinone/menaquinone biosynthesis C-methylase UbiE/uncharacterized protein YbaR (Trm112 family)